MSRDGGSTLLDARRYATQSDPLGKAERIPKEIEPDDEIPERAISELKAALGKS